MEYALTVQAVDGIVVSCLDNSPWDEYVESYINVPKIPIPSNIIEQEYNTTLLNSVDCVFKKFETAKSDYKKRAEEISNILNKKLLGFSSGKNRWERFINIE